MGKWDMVDKNGKRGNGQGENKRKWAIQLPVPAPR